MAKKQGYKDEEDESIGTRLGKKKTKHDKKVARDESYGKWGKRSKDWKQAKSGAMITAKGGTMIKAKKGKLGKILAAGVAATAAYAGAKKMGYGYKKSTSGLGQWDRKNPNEMKKWSKYVSPARPHKTLPVGAIQEKKGDLYSEVMGLSKKGGLQKAKNGKMVKARCGVIVNTKLNGPLFTETF